MVCSLAGVSDSQQPEDSSSSEITVILGCLDAAVGSDPTACFPSTLQLQLDSKTASAGVLFGGAGSSTATNTVDLSSGIIFTLSPQPDTDGNSGGSDQSSGFGNLEEAR